MNKKGEDRGLSGSAVAGQEIMISKNKGRFRLNIRNNFLMERVEKHWHRLLRDVVDAPCQETLKVRLYRLSEQTDLVEVIPSYCSGDGLLKALSSPVCLTSQ